MTRSNPLVTMKKLISGILMIFFSMSLLISCEDKGDSLTDGNGYNHSDTLVLIHACLIDGTGSYPVSEAVIVIQNGYIKAAGADSLINFPAGSEIIDLHDAYVLPGFINCHVHSGYNTDNLKEWAQSGVTAVRDLGNFKHPPNQAFGVRDNLLEDNMNARLIATGPLITTINGYGNYEVASPEDAETKTEELINKGADLIKIAIEDDLQGRLWPMLSLEEVTTIVQTAHRLKKKVSAHISRTKHVNMAVAGDADDLAHMPIDNVPDSIITSVVVQDVYWVPTLELWKHVSDRYNLNWDILAIDNLHRFSKAGGKVALGTDYDGYDAPFELGMPMQEIQLMQQAGMSPMQIIIAATKNAAAVCDMENELGTIEPGKIADIIVVSTNPLDNLQVLSDVQIVIHNGKIIKGDERL